MRIGFDARWYNDSGVGTYVLELLSALSISREDFEIVVYEDSKNPVPIESHRFQRRSVRSARYTLSEQYEFVRHSCADRIDVFHSPFFVVPLALGCPVVLTVHDLIPLIFKTYSPLKRRLWRTGCAMAIRKAARVIADSRRTAVDLQQLLNVNREKITIIHCGAGKIFEPAINPNEMEYLRERYKAKPPYVMLLGAKHWKTKNLGLGLQALAHCRRQGDCFQTVFVGNQLALDQDPEARLGIDRDLLCTGHVSGEDLAKLYRQAEVFLLPSKYEGFGIPLVEAMNCGCAVVCSDGGSLPEIAGAGAVVTEQTIASIAREITTLLNDEQTRLEQRRRALTRAADFSWSRAAREVLTVYKEVTNRETQRLSRGAQMHQVVCNTSGAAQSEKAQNS